MHCNILRKIKFRDYKQINKTFNNKLILIEILELLFFLLVLNIRREVYTFPANICLNFYFYKLSKTANGRYIWSI